MAENFETADVIRVLVRDKNPVKLCRRDATLFKTQSDLARAETAIDKELAMISGDQRTISRAPAAENGQAEHGSQDTCVISVCANGNGQLGAKIVIPFVCQHETVRSVLHREFVRSADSRRPIVLARHY
jgi:hypothetical protein